jgi:hypothetical protein
MVVPPDALREDPAEPEAAPQPAAEARRVRIVLVAVVLLAVAAALIVWGLLR